MNICINIYTNKYTSINIYKYIYIYTYIHTGSHDVLIAKSDGHYRNLVMSSGAKKH
jgi:hypothetical protein